MDMVKIIRKIINIVGQLNPEKYARKIGVVFGEECRFIGRTDWGSEPYLIEIGNHTEVSFGCTFLTHDGSTWCFREKKKYKGVSRFGRIKIGNNCFIGCKTIIMPNVKIGDNCIIGAGSLVNKNIPSGEVWGGVPAHYITTIDQFAEKCLREAPKLSNKKYKNKKEWVLDCVNMEN